MSLSTDFHPTNNLYSSKLIKWFTFYFLFFLGVTQSYSQDELLTIKVSVDNVMNNNGKVIFSLHNQDTFMKTESLQRAESNIENNKVEVTFENVAPGTYAIMVLHDENENYRMDFDTNGMPIESYGMSNNPLSYGPPQFSDAKFEVDDEDLDFKIRF
jgi:uncharacterized protein (DUF2141 family)